MAGVLLISEQKLLSFTSINKNVDRDLIKAEITVTQEINLQQVLGTKFLNSLYSKVTSTGDTFNNDEKILINDYVAPYLIQKSYANLLPQLWSRTLNRGVMVGEAESSTSVDVNTLKYLKGIQDQRAGFYEQRLQDYLCINYAKFPLYVQQSNLDGMTPNKNKHYQSSIVLDKPIKIKGVENYSEDENMFKKY